MNNFPPRLNLIRLRNLLVIEIVNQYKKYLLITGAAVTFMIFWVTIRYLDTGGVVNDSLFLFLLLVAGAVITGSIFSDLHHPLQCMHYLTLPCSNLERLLSKYLLTGFVFMSCALLVNKAFLFLSKTIIVFITGADYEISISGFSYIEIVLTYLTFHSVLVLGAILFKRNSFLKTLLLLLFIYVSVVFVFLISLKIVYWDWFGSVLSLYAKELDPGYFLSWLKDLLIANPFLWMASLFFFNLWVLYLSYICLQEYEI